MAQTKVKLIEDNAVKAHHIDETSTGVALARLLISSTAPILDFVDTNSFTDPNDRFRIRAAGDVGQVRWYDDSAGTDTVLATFSPYGDYSILGNITASGGVINLYQNKIDGSTDNLKISSDYNNVSGSSTIEFLIDGSEKMRIDSSGNVGINKNPENFAQLEIKADTNGKAALLLDSNALAESAYIKYEVGGSGGWQTGMKGSGAGYDYVFAYGDFDTSGNEKITITNTGEVGIGTDSPASKLVVKSNAQTLELRGDNHTYIGFYRDNATRSGYFGHPTGSNSSMTLMNETNNSLYLGTNSANRIVVDNVGRVTINDTGTTIGGSATDVSAAWLQIGTGLGFDDNQMFFVGDGYINSTGTLSLAAGASGADEDIIIDTNGNTIFNGHIYGKSLVGNFSNIYRIGGIYFTWESSTYGTNFNHSITSTKDGNYGDNITINSYGDVRINIDSNGNGTNTFSIGTSTTGSANNTRLSLDESGNLTILGSLIMGTTIQMANNDGFVYDDATNIMYVRADGSNKAIITANGGTFTGAVTLAGGLAMNNTNITGVNNIVINDAGANEGIQWAGGNGWKIYESPDTLTNASGNLQFVLGSTRKFTVYTNSGAKVQTTSGYLKYGSLNNSWVHYETDRPNHYFYEGIWAGGYQVQTSDARIKENVVTIDNALDKVNSLRGVYYNRIGDKDKERQIGFIAQEVNEVVPELAAYAEDMDEWAVKYANFVGLHNEAIKELSNQIDALKAEIELLKQA